MDAVLALHSATTPLAETNWVGNNGSRYRNPEYDALVDRFLTTIPMAERMQALGEVVRHITVELPILGLYYRVQPTMTSHRLQKVTARQILSTEAWNAHEWTLR